MPEKLKFVFKGNRDYVQGTSLFNALVDAAGERGAYEGEIDVSFKKMVHNPICLLEQREPTPDDAVIAKICTSDGKQITLVLNAASEIENADRQEFDEYKVCHGAVVGNKRIIQAQPYHLDLIELLVSLCKKMHIECVDASKKWVFSRYVGQIPIPDPAKVELNITKQVGTRLTCSNVVINDKKIGNIYFS